MKNNTKKNELNEDKNQKDDRSYWLPIGMCIGLSLGVTIGAATNNIGLWLPIGLCLGVSLGAVLSNDKYNKKK